MAMAGGRARMRWHRPGEILYRDAVSRGPSRLPSQSLFTRIAAAAPPPPSEKVETIPSDGLRSLLYNKRLPALYADRAKKAPSLLTAGKLAKAGPYTRRHKFPGYAALLELFDRGCIVEAMTRFYLASRSWALVYNGELDPKESAYEVSPHIVHDIMERLARIATTPAGEWQGFVQSTPRENCWIPSQLSSSSVALRGMAVPKLAFHALVDVFDMGGAVGIMPDDTAMASIFQAFSYHLDVQSFTKCVHLTLLRLGGLSLSEAKLEFAKGRTSSLPPDAFNALPRVAIRAIIEGYGRMGAPYLGEALLRKWSAHTTNIKVQGSSTNDKRAARDWHMASDRSVTIDAPVSVDSSGWAGDANIWLALIRSRSSAFDLAGARHWLNRYREEGLSIVRSELGGYKCGQPHLAYLSALSQFRPSHSRAADGVKDAGSYLDNGKTRYRAIIDTIRWMHEDGAAMTEQTFITCINLHLGFNKMNEAASMIKLLLRSKDSLMVRRPSLYRIFFRLHRALHTGTSFDVHQLQMLARQGTDGSTHYVADLRMLFREFWSTYTAEGAEWTRKDMLDTLTEALHASFATRDLPLASVMLSKLREFKHSSTDQLFAIVTSSLADEPTEKRSNKIEKASNHQRALAANMRAWMRGLESEDTPYEEITFTSKYYSEGPGRQHKVLDALIRAVNNRIIEDVSSGLKRQLEESDPAWLHTACTALKKRRDFDGHDDILDLTTAPIRDGLLAKRGKLGRKSE